ncbi:MAG: glycosyltransferase involved in cell wall biosynthesis [Crocinitomix sp.]|jgi:glycosyltransferase involved in cell wall biosynthesis
MSSKTSQGKRVLIISYYWPPSGGAGVHRWLKVSKYLAENNEVFVYTPANPDFALKDESLLEKVSPKIKVLKRKIFEPYFIYRAFIKKSDKSQVNQPSSVDASKSPIKRMGKWARGNMFIPDPRVFWVKPSYRYLKKVIQEENIEVVISTGPPHSMHLIGLKLKNYFGDKINWIADFRDPWTNIDFYDMLSVGKRADNKNRRLEKQVIQTCNTLVTVSESWAGSFEELGAGRRKVITNGFDNADYKQVHEKNNSHFAITHLGSINADRNPEALWIALSELCQSKEGFKANLRVRLVGNVHANVNRDVAKYGLTDNVNFVPNMAHKDAIEELYNSSLSLLLLNDAKNIDGIIPGKVFEYMGVGNPILAIGKPDGDAGNIITGNGLGTITNFGDSEAAQKAVTSFYEAYLNNNLKGFTKENLEKFSIKTISESFEAIF